MESSSSKPTRKSNGIKRMSSVAIRTLSVNEAIADALKAWPTNSIVRIVKTSKRTVENWKQARTGPQAKHVAALLQSADLRPAMLTALGCKDLATQAEILSLNRRITALKAAEAAHGEETHGLRRDLEMGRAPHVVAGRTSQQRRETLAPDDAVVSRPPK